MCWATNSQPSQLQYFLWWLMTEKSRLAVFTAKCVSCLCCSYLLNADTRISADRLMNARRAQNFSHYKSHTHHLKPRYTQMYTQDSTLIKPGHLLDSLITADGRCLSRPAPGEQQIPPHHHPALSNSILISSNLNLFQRADPTVISVQLFEATSSLVSNTWFFHFCLRWHEKWKRGKYLLCCSYVSLSLHLSHVSRCSL